MLHRHDMYWTTVPDLSRWSPTSETLFVNTLPHASCDVVSVGNDTEHHNVQTIRDMSELSLLGSKRHCAVYCAHPACGAAKKAMKDRKEELLRYCFTVDYIVEGVRGMMQDERFEITDSDACEESLQSYRRQTSKTK